LFEILEFVKESMMMVLFVSFKITLLCEKKKKTSKISQESNEKKSTLKKDEDEDITLNKFLIKKEHEYKRQGLDKVEIDDKLAVDSRIWEKTHGSWHDNN